MATATETQKDENEAALELLALDIRELRKRAASIYRITVTKDMDKEDIVRMILEKQKRTAFATVVNDGDNGLPKPGWARIMVMKDNTTGAKNRPIYWMINGRKFCVPRGIKVDVPIKLVDGPMRDAIEYHMEEDLGEAINSSRRFQFKPRASYPFVEECRTPGPDPYPGDEVARGAKRAMEYRFRDMHGYWPRSQELRNWLAQIALANTTGNNNLGGKLNELSADLSATS
jgi:hypothetical protein